MDAIITKGNFDLIAEITNESNRIVVLKKK